MALTKAQQALQLANLCKMRGQMIRTRAVSHVAQGYSIDHPEIQAMLRAAKTEEEAAAIIARYVRG